MRFGRLLRIICGHVGPWVVPFTLGFPSCSPLYLPGLSWFVSSYWSDDILELKAAKKGFHLLVSWTAGCYVTAYVFVCFFAEEKSPDERVALLRLPQCRKDTRPS